ncbi:MAG: hypothetical protein HY038_00500 [Nitrospirae bacterium]|nr:hypothetical protein [Nitrospirota bacterium]
MRSGDDEAFLTLRACLVHARVGPMVMMDAFLAGDGSLFSPTSAHVRDEPATDHIFWWFSAQPEYEKVLDTLLGRIFSLTGPA